MKGLSGLCMTAVATHVVTTFYSKTFQWRDLTSEHHLGIIRELYSSRTTLLKALSCYFLIWLCLNTNAVRPQTGSLLTLLLALPQLYRSQGPTSRQMRVVLGPLTPILAVNNVCLKPCLGSAAMVSVSFAAFVVLRPDNTTVLDLFWPPSNFSEEAQLLPPKLYHSILANGNQRRQLHGLLAACNVAMALHLRILWTFPHLLNDIVDDSLFNAETNDQD